MSDGAPLGLDWPGLMRAGLRELQLPPEAFWRLTPVELMLMLGLGGARAPLTRARLEDLVRAYPDAGTGRAKGQDDGGCDAADGRDRRAGGQPGGVGRNGGDL
ncbi:hypothetical protein GCM10008024_11330 [Allgaiera indica]|uniref:Phage tail assembly chaperone n=1 Tax=Allgaiera indica TaxID=765699 RepID=A0AAN4UQ24_9RHOB|nr:hypothetical protein GCM10008024_11330 [Allgaiera indica]